MCSGHWAIWAKGIRKLMDSNTAFYQSIQPLVERNARTHNQVTRQRRDHAIKRRDGLSGQEPSMKLLTAQTDMVDPSIYEEHVMEARSVYLRRID